MDISKNDYKFDEKSTSDFYFTTSVINLKFCLIIQKNTEKIEKLIL